MPEGSVLTVKQKPAFSAIANNRSLVRDASDNILFFCMTFQGEDVITFRDVGKYPTTQSHSPEHLNSNNALWAESRNFMYVKTFWYVT
jgi:hypothetical protein